MEAQVGMMDQIFSDAQMVIAWLGLDLDSQKPSRRILHLADKLMAYLESDMIHGPVIIGNTRSLHPAESFLNPMEQFLVGRAVDYLPDDLQLVELFFNKLWSRRVWM
jgi:hypothetical protein